MLTTMKYEFMKNRILYAISLGTLALLQVVYLVMLPFSSIKSSNILIPLFLIFMAGTIIFFLIIINGISLFSRDLRSKSGYLVYMTPTPIPFILSAKILLVYLSSIIFTLGFFFLGLADLHLLILAGGKYLKDDNDLMPRVIKYLLDNFSTADVALKLLQGAVIVFNFLSTVYFSIGLSQTLLRNKRFGGLISFLIFIAITVFNSFVSHQISSNVLTYIFHVGLGVFCFIGTSYLLVRKIDL
ncbi:hypothetical protein SAMN02910400_00558 [Lachnospiraceae bacterium C10]|nr:hypothetical protein SAMN02910400_00558 [Lachnospiraceae bacterium C10]